ncbi:MAG: PqqD family peptide modification chaperone [Pseudomonadota bacterium]
MNDSHFFSHTKIARADGLLSSYIGEELLMMSMSQSKYFNMNSVGSRIWELLETPTTQKELVTALTSEYEVSHDTARQQVEAFVVALRERHMLTFSDSTPA